MMSIVEKLDELVLKSPSFKKIMEDGVVTEEELTEQKERVIALLKKFEQNSTPEQIYQFLFLLAEISVLVSIKQFSK